MFLPKTARISDLANKNPDRIAELEGIFNGTTNVYLDYANIKPWANKLGWHIEPKRLKQFCDSLDTIRTVKFYHGTLVGDADSEAFMAEIGRLGFDVCTKPVKKMKRSIDASKIPLDSSEIVKDFIPWPLLEKFGTGATGFALWSGDSDFADPVRQLLGDGKKVVLFATAGRVSSELSALTKKGLLIFDIRKIRDFICWKKEMTS